MEEKAISTKSSSGSDTSKFANFQLKDKDETDYMGFDSDVQSDSGLPEQLLSDEAKPQRTFTLVETKELKELKEALKAKGKDVVDD